MKKPTILDVADTAGVAVGTVSRYLNDQRIRKDNRTRIEQAIADLGYRANTLARAMKTERTNTVGYLVPKFDEFNSGILTQLVRSLRARGYSIVTFHHSDEADAINEALESASSRRIDAIILSGTHEVTEKVQELLTGEQPVIIFNNDVPGVETDKVLVNDEAAAQDAVSRMIDFGHTRIGVVTGDLNGSTGQNRLQGYKKAHEQAGLSVDEELVYVGNWGQLDGYTAMDRFLGMENPPSAVFFSNYLMTIGGLDCLSSNGKQVGKDIDLVTFDDPDMFRLIPPGITAIEQPIEQIARHLTEIVLSRLDGTAPDHPRNIRVNCALKLRGSLGVARKASGKTHEDS
ncbi:periplasmic binding protein/LacI transcriptional regulator (plasmid) [Pseudovibrio sp. FO-BEG1]|uniref:Transcriptional regulator, LacI family n=1 Tax=Pseudovibrio denitrificans TaxID=258256 RepID=A0A1I7D024_9HYPH|nr:MULTISPECIES: LacI family DNA-binding transcriptional regulator [Pseudovibrio]AEV39790.1 periplasmic binding protein/LacI transcriptional regulator [Pseudovibrio sp. FO-BEG1]SFU04991.1 transcriptional regulator, LacI family [Pseudovibrio denitrificans]